MPCNLTNIFSAFRVAAWKLICHNENIVNLGAAYEGCPIACRRPEADMRRGCPDCAVTELYEQFLEELTEELANVAEKKDYCEPGKGQDYKWAWSREKLISDVSAISGFDARLDGKGFDPKWTTPIKTLVQILRDERRVQDRIRDEERERELDAITRGGRTNK